MTVFYVLLAIVAWGGYSFVLYRQQQQKAQTLIANPEFIKQVTGLVKEGKTETEVANVLRTTYKLPLLTGRLIYQQVKKKLEN